MECSRQRNLPLCPEGGRVPDLRELPEAEHVGGITGGNGVAAADSRGLGARLPGFKSWRHFLASDGICQGLCRLFCKLEISLHRVENLQSSHLPYPARGLCTQQARSSATLGVGQGESGVPSQPGRIEPGEVKIAHTLHSLAHSLFVIVALLPLSSQ